MIETFIHKKFNVGNWNVIFKLIATPERKKKYPSHLAITITTYENKFTRTLHSAMVRLKLIER